MKTKILAFICGIIIATCGSVVAQSVTTLGADYVIANISLTSPAGIIPNITAHGPGNVISNTALGNSVFNAGTTGPGNVGIGSFALQNIGADQQNTAVGVDAFNACAGSCAYGTAVGWGAGQSNLNGYGTFIGYDAGLGITTGTYNTVVGTSAFNTGSGITTGSGNTILGAQVTGLAAATANNIILANGAGTIKARHNGNVDWTFSDSSTFNQNINVLGAANPALVNIGTIGVSNAIINSPTSLGLNITSGGTPNSNVFRVAFGTANITGGTELFKITEVGAANFPIHMQTIGTTPTIANGACGAGANGTIAGSDQNGKITIAGAATAACAVSFSTVFTTAPQSCTFSPATAASAAVQAYVSALTVNGFTISATALATTSWYYHCF